MKILTQPAPNVIAIRALATLVLLTAYILFSMSTVTSVFALSLDEAKASGQVGEKGDGYLGVVSPSAGPEAKSLADEINQQRRAQYEQIAKKNGTELNAVEILAGKKAVERTPAGQYVLSASGQWMKR